MDSSAKTLVIRHGTLIDGSGQPPSVNDALVVQDDRITSVGRLPAGIQLEDDKAVRVIDASGRWIMPGLIDAHTHLSYGYPHLRGEGRGRGPSSRHSRPPPAPRRYFGPA